MADTEEFRRRIPLGLIGMLVLVGAAERYVARQSDRWSPALVMTWRMAGEAARRESVGCDVLCFGDSQFYYAVDPPVLEQRSGLRAYSFAVPGAQAATSYTLFREALAAGARPRAVMVDFNDNQLASFTRKFAWLWPEVLGARELVTLTGLSLDPRIALEAFGSQPLPSLRARDGIRAEVLAAVRREPDTTASVLASIRREIRDHRGARPLPHVPRDHTAAMQALFRASGGSGRWSCHPANAFYVRRFLALAAAHDIPVYWVLPPVTPAAQAWQERTSREAAVLSYIQTLQRAFPNLTIVDARALGIDPSYFHDPTHLDGEGGVVLTQALADALKRSDLSADRWAVLPAMASSRPPVRR